MLHLRQTGLMLSAVLVPFIVAPLCKDLDGCAKPTQCSRQSLPDPAITVARAGVNVNAGNGFCKVTGR